jgi:O-antigen ligase
VNQELRPPSSLAIGWLLPPAVFLFILPFAHTIALRWTAALVTLGIAIWQWRRGPRIPALPCKAAFAFWVVSLLLSLSGATNLARSVSDLRVDVVYSLAMFLAFYALTRGARELRIWLLALARGSLAISLLAIIYFLWYGDWLLGYQNMRGEFATCMITALPAILLLAKRGMPWTGKNDYLQWILPVMLVAGLFTLSRMFLGALILMMLLATGLETMRGRLSLRHGLIFVAIASALAAIALFAISEERGVSLGNDPRPEIWSFAWQRITEHPWIGTGYGNMPIPHDSPPTLSELGYSRPHNLLLAYAEQAGVFGAIAIMVVFVALGREYWGLYRSDELSLSYVGIAGLAILAGVLAKNMTAMFFTRECALLFWSLNGALLGYGRRMSALADAGRR